MLLFETRGRFKLRLNIQNRIMIWRQTESSQRLTFYHDNGHGIRHKTLLQQYVSGVKHKRVVMP